MWGGDGGRLMLIYLLRQHIDQFRRTLVFLLLFSTSFLKEGSPRPPADSTSASGRHEAVNQELSLLPLLWNADSVGGSSGVMDGSESL